MRYAVKAALFFLTGFFLLASSVEAEIKVRNELQNAPISCKNDNDVKRNQFLLKKVRSEIKKANRSSKNQFGYLECRVIKECIDDEKSYYFLNQMAPVEHDLKSGSSPREIAETLNRLWEFVLVVHDPSRCGHIKATLKTLKDRIIKSEVGQFNEMENGIKSLEAALERNRVSANKKDEMDSLRQTLKEVKDEVNRKSNIQGVQSLDKDDQWVVEQIASQLSEMGYGPYLGNLSVQKIFYKIDPSPSIHPAQSGKRFEFDHNSFLLQFGCDICSQNFITVGSPTNFNFREFGTNLDSPKKSVSARIRKISVIKSVMLLAQALKTRRMDDHLKSVRQLNDLHLKNSGRTQMLYEDRIKKYRLLLTK